MGSIPPKTHQHLNSGYFYTVDERAEPHTPMTTTQNRAPVTAAQEAVTSAMLAALLACTVASYAIVQYLSLTTATAYLVLGIASFVIGGYLVPNLTALWLGRPLYVIMDTELDDPEQNW